MKLVRIGAAHRQRGQILPTAVLGVLIASMILALMYRNGNAITEKSELANAADAAAYSGAVWTARHLNFMAYTNRAMVANHVTVGHFVSYMSWYRYVAGAIKQFNKYARFIPYIGPVINQINAIIQANKQFTEASARILVPTIDGANALYRAAQLEAKGTLALGGLTDLMQRTARSYNESINVNDLSDISSLPVAASAPLLADLGLQQAQLFDFMRQFTASNDGGRLNELVDRSLRANEDLRRWVSGTRGWSVSFGCVRFRKEGSTRHTQTAAAADWRATDRLRDSFCDPFGDFDTVGRAGSASAREFARGYRGVASYYELSNRQNRGRPSEQPLQVTAVVTKPQNRVGLPSPQGFANKPLMGLSNSAQPMASMASAVAEFKRPGGVGFTSLGSNVEYGNLFNPFWNGRLAKFDLLDRILSFAGGPSPGGGQVPVRPPGGQVPVRPPGGQVPER